MYILINKIYRHIYTIVYYIVCLLYIVNIWLNFYSLQYHTSKEQRPYSITTQSEIPWGKDERTFPWPRGDEATYWRLSYLSIVKRSRAWKAVKHATGPGSFYWCFFYWSLTLSCRRQSIIHLPVSCELHVYCYIGKNAPFQSSNLWLLFCFFFHLFFCQDTFIIISWIFALGTINHYFLHLNFIFSNNTWQEFQL